MTRQYLTAVFAAGVLGVYGCGSRGVVTTLPDPLFATARAETPGPIREPLPPPTVAVRPRSSGVRPGSGWIPSSGIRRRWQCIVIHHSGGEVGGAEAFDRYHRRVRRWDELGYHFVIGNGSDTGDGVVEVGSRWIKQKHGAHCKTPDNYFNDHGIGICLVGDFTEHAPSRAQMIALTRLVGFLLEECGIDVSRIITHSSVTHRTDCPGSRFSLASLRSRLAGRVNAVSHAP